MAPDACTSPCHYLEIDHPAELHLNQGMPGLIGEDDWLLFREHAFTVNPDEHSIQQRRSLSAGGFVDFVAALLLKRRPIEPDPGCVPI